MTGHFNGLTPAEAERLAILIEECGEVISMACKVLRHGYESTDPTDILSPTNREMVAGELGQVWQAINAMVKAGDISAAIIHESEVDRWDRIKPYLHHQCDHDWVSIVNPVVKNGSMCQKCGELKA